MKSFGSGLNVAVAGATGGIGKALCAQLVAMPSVNRLYSLSRVQNADANSIYFDLTVESSIAAAAEAIKDSAGVLHLVVVATGVLHDGATFQPEKNWRGINPENFERAFRVNATGPALVAKYFLPLLARDRKVAFAALSARVGSISDNDLGGWYAYRASKAALSMLIRGLSIELARRSPDALCVGLHPGTVDTGLSTPFQSNVPRESLFSPDYASARLLEVLDALTAADTGGVFAWDGARIPP
ncbi:MAG: hypothetical protein CL573_01655 [Alphaproteobacteria bacterium]|nr:hypothetical protein [Alphaproteobacteria bacterium]HCP00064.1 hypothetical protein [Rhodospirillaceae bacterium]